MWNLLHCLAILLLLFPRFASCNRGILVTDRVELEISIGGEYVGQITIGLYGKDAPLTVENFKYIASEGIEGRTYEGTNFFRVIQRFMIQGGDIVYNNGSGSVSLHGPFFEDEITDLKHTSAGVISMANLGPNTNGCQFFITTIATPWLDDKHTIFGRVIKGEGLIHKIEYLKTDVLDRPVLPVVITKARIIPTPTPFYVLEDPNEITLWAWVKAGWFPLSFSFAILAFFHYIMKRLDDYKLKEE